MFHPCNFFVKKCEGVFFFFFFKERYVPPHLRNRQGPPPGRGDFHGQGFNPRARDFGPRDPYRGLCFLKARLLPKKIF